jgi:tRNA uridine 5-carboxymethylaminomethyl modification enzyme
MARAVRARARPLPFSVPHGTHEFAVIVVGGGHAGVEAAWAAANLLPAGGSPFQGEFDRPRPPIALVTLDPAKIGEMSCNPAIGGLAKGQVVREVDALGGLMALATDFAGIQFKMLNTSKGPAVHGPRAQCDKHLYAQAVRALIASRPEIQVIGASVDRLLIERAGVAGAMRTRCVGVTVRDAAGAVRELRASAVVLTTGTFMRGLMHTGESRTAGGRFGEGAAHAISDALRELGLELGRLKTGTPPRLARDSIRWQELDEQPPDEQPVPFSELTDARQPTPAPHELSAWWQGSLDATAESSTRAALDAWRDEGFVLSRFPAIPQASCRTTRTTREAHDLIRDNVHRAPMYNGQIQSAGPRYCPSIEDKVVRFADRDQHGVFLEPESLRSDWVYCNGISTSLPADVQERIVRAMPGCEQARIHRFGYAVEYDMVRPHQIEVTSACKLAHGLFLAGQINGTSGYEEAAGQGVIAGINAALLALGKGEFVLGRDEAYIGVMMDDLVTKTPVEPYRMFTSRAEHRLMLRADNAPDRLTPRALAIGALGTGPLGARRKAAYERRTTDIALLQSLVDATRVDGEPLEKLLRGQALEAPELRRALAGVPAAAPICDGAWRTVHADRRYAAYIVRERAAARRHADLEHKRLPDGMDYLAITHLREEARQALHRFRPRTFGQASRLEGITPADITLLTVLAARHRLGGSGVPA